MEPARGIEPPAYGLRRKRPPGNGLLDRRPTDEWKVCEIVREKLPSISVCVPGSTIQENS